MADSLHPDHQDLLQFMYQLPIGVIDMDEQGTVSTINPPASRLLSTELIDGESVAYPLPMLRRLVPDLFATLRSEPDRLGTISSGRGEEVDSRDGRTRFTVTVHRIRRDRIIVALTDVTEERRLLNEQRARASRLQAALLGRIDPTELEVSVAYVPAHRGDLSGGDWYDVIKIDADRFALVVGDVVGHDIEASATMGQLRAIVRAFALVDADPSSVLERTETLARTIDGAKAATVHYLLLDQAASTVSYSSAGHPPPLVIRADGSAHLLADGRRPVLAAVDAPERNNATARLQPDDILLMYTDGLIERRGETLDVGFERLKSAALRLRSVDSIDELVEELTAAMLDRDGSHEDDVCVLAVRHHARSVERTGS